MHRESHLYRLLQRRVSRRRLLAAGGAALAVSQMPLCVRAETTPALAFKEIPHGTPLSPEVAEGYSVQTVLRWGDKLFEASPAFAPNALTLPSQKQWFGYNNDFLTYLPHPEAENPSAHGLLCVNHEYPSLEFMAGKAPDTLSAPELEAIMAALGHSVVEVKREASGWRTVFGVYNRRINGWDSAVALSGPVAGHERVRTSANPEGKTALGTFGNCSGGVTPWGTVLSAEENIDQYFSGKPTGREEENHLAMGISGKPSFPQLAKADRRFDVSLEPNEPNRFGWVVEIDPFDPTSLPVKRTALGRFKHEAATCALTPDNRVAVYMGDDEAFQYLYRFVSKNAYHPETKERNRNLLDEGTLYVAVFDEETVTWTALIHGEGPLTASNGFHSQADVLIETRKAAKLLGATDMDRPEDVETNPANGHVYVVLTNNRKRVSANEANTRRVNLHGHILELTPPETSDGAKDHGAEKYRWQPFLLAGDPDNPLHRAYYPNKISRHGWLACPDNIAFDPRGRMWIATDGQGKAIGANDGIFMAETAGHERGATRHFFNAPLGAEVCGPCFTPDGATLFACIQHPAEGSGYNEPATRWPDFDPALPPRPGVVAIERNDKKAIG